MAREANGKRCSRWMGNPIKKILKIHSLRVPAEKKKMDSQKSLMKTKKDTYKKYKG